MNTFNLFIKFNLIPSIAFLFTLLPINVTFAGGINGGGGKGVLCGSKLTVLDLYEAKQDKFTIPAPLGNTDAEIDRFGHLFLNHFWAEIRNNEDQEKQLLQQMKNLLNQKSSASENSSIKWESNLPFTNDATLPTLEPGCRPVQIAINRIVSHQDSREVEISIDPIYWDLLDSINKVALFFHEFSYSRVRSSYNLNDEDRNRLTSDETRKVIAQLFADVRIPNIAGPHTKDKSRIWCGFGGGPTNGEYFEIYVYEETKNLKKGLGLYFYGFKERLVASRTYGFLPGFSLDQLMSKTSIISKPGLKEITDVQQPNFPTQTITVYNKIMDKKWRLKLGTYENGLTIQAFEPGTPVENLPNLSPGFCSLEEN